MHYCKLMGKDPSFKKQEKNRGTSLSDYWPLFVLILIALLSASAVTYHIQGALLDWMHLFMGFFLCQFAMLKLFHPKAFADGFEMYDLIAKKSRTYALIYPVIELALGLGYLSFLFPIYIYSATIIIMAIGSVGVILALRKGLDINCPCMGSILDVPLSTVTLTEDFGMGILALGMLIQLVST